MALGKEKKKKKSTEGLKIYFPANIQPNLVKGTISLYRPSNQVLDQTIPLELSSNYLLIPKSRLVGGRWDITLDYTYEGKGYLKQETLVM